MLSLTLPLSDSSPFQCASMCIHPSMFHVSLLKPASTSLLFLPVDAPQPPHIIPSLPLCGCVSVCLVAAHLTLPTHTSARNQLCAHLPRCSFQSSSDRCSSLIGNLFCLPVCLPVCLPACQLQQLPLATSASHTTSPWSSCATVIPIIKSVFHLLVCVLHLGQLVNNMNNNII